MISLFEPTGPRSSDLPIDLVTRGARGVALLQFVALNEAPAEAAAPRA